MCARSQCFLAWIYVIDVDFVVAVAVSVGVISCPDFAVLLCGVVNCPYAKVTPKNNKNKFCVIYYGCVLVLCVVVCYFNYDDLGFSVAFLLLSLFHGYAYARPNMCVYVCMCQ